jgi:ferredoxin, 2Fe-2S
VSHIKFIQRDGIESVVEISSGVSVMLAAVRNGIAGIDGECGGCLDCATCHVYVDGEQLSHLPAPKEDELELLGAVTTTRKPNSRLSCQLKAPFPVTPLTVYVPETER